MNRAAGAIVGELHGFSSAIFFFTAHFLQHMDVTVAAVQAYKEVSDIKRKLNRMSGSMDVADLGLGGMIKPYAHFVSGYVGGYGIDAVNSVASVLMKESGRKFVSGVLKLGNIDVPLNPKIKVGGFESGALHFFTFVVGVDIKSPSPPTYNS